ncbi:hypothetical protein [Priestia aryabhattai]
MDLIFKFTDGAKVKVPNFEEFSRKGNNADFLDVFQDIKANDKNLVLNGDNGIAVKRTGKDLASIEILFD